MSFEEECAFGRIQSETLSPAQRNQKAIAIVAAVTRMVPIKYLFDCSQLSCSPSAELAVERPNCAEEFLSVRTPASCGRSQSRQSVRPSETGKPQAEHFPILLRST